MIHLIPQVAIEPAQVRRPETISQYRRDALARSPLVHQAHLAGARGFSLDQHDGLDIVKHGTQLRKPVPDGDPDPLNRMLDDNQTLKLLHGATYSLPGRLAVPRWRAAYTSSWSLKVARSSRLTCWLIASQEIASASASRAHRCR